MKNFTYSPVQQGPWCRCRCWDNHSIELEPEFLAVHLTSNFMRERERERGGGGGEDRRSKKEGERSEGKKE